ncbi:MAG: hypothetical protein R3336_09750 [Phycisphaeraceae bacterium]|nr:hypothetical protein [Phycisphaeraceae bacterium]
MKASPLTRGFFAIAALYDGVLGQAFLVVPATVFETFDLPMGGPAGYVRFPAAMLIIFAAMLATVAVAPRRNRNLIPFGMLLKIAYIGVVGFDWVRLGEMPTPFIVFAVADLLFLVGFAAAWNHLAGAEPEGSLATGA